MFKFCFIGAILFFSISSGSAVPHPFDLVKDAAYDQVIINLEDIMATLNGTRGAGTAAKVIFKVGEVFIGMYKKPDPMEQNLIAAIERQTEILLESMAEMKYMLDTILDELNIQFSKIQFDMKYAAMQEVMIDIEVFFSDFVLHLVNYKDIEELAPRLRTLTEELRSARLDMKMIRIAVNDDGFTDSLVYSYAKFLEYNPLGVITSPNQQVMFFYQNILMYSHKANILLELCYELLQELEEKDLTSDINYVRDRLKLNQNDLTNGAKRNFQEFDQLRYQFTFVQKVKESSSVEGKDYFYLGRVWYTYIVEFLSIENDHKKCVSCSRFSEEKFVNFGRCAGTISKCSNAGNSNTNIVTAKVVDNESRLYSGYSVDGTWYGEQNGPGKNAWYFPAIFTEPAYPFPRIYICPVCRCFCNNKNGQNSGRNFYNKIMEAPNGYVVTGARFVKEVRSEIKKTVIFVQIQVAELIDLARVNQTTARWIDLPSSVSTNDLHILDNPDRQYFVEGNLEFSKKAYVTGLQFVYERELSGDQKLYVKAFGREVTVNNGNVNLGNKIVASFKDQKKIKLELTDEKIDARQHVNPAIDGQNVDLADSMPLTGMKFLSYNVKFPRRDITFYNIQLRTDTFGQFFP